MKKDVVSLIESEIASLEAEIRRLDVQRREQWQALARCREALSVLHGANRVPNKVIPFERLSLRLVDQTGKDQ